MADLSALVTMALLYDADLILIGNIQLIDNVLANGKIGFTHCRNNNCGRVVGQECSQAVHELRIVWLGVDDRKDDCDIAGTDAWILWDWNWLVKPEGDDVDDQAEVPPDKEGNEELSSV